MKTTSCGVIVTDGRLILLGHATRTPRWDIFKGLAETGESFETAARRELFEETGLDIGHATLRDLGVHRYLPTKALALFVWQPDILPDPAGLRCHAQFAGPAGHMLPEIDRFAAFSWPEAATKVGRNLARILTAVWPAIAASA